MHTATHCNILQNTATHYNTMASKRGLLKTPLSQYQGGVNMVETFLLSEQGKEKDSSLLHVSSDPFLSCKECRVRDDRVGNIQMTVLATRNSETF